MKIYIVMIPCQPPIYILIQYKDNITGNSVSLKFRGAQIWNKLPNVFKIIKHCTPFKKGAEAYAVFCIRYFSNTKHKSAKKKILDNVFQSNCSSHAKV